jgi:trypsin
VSQVNKHASYSSSTIDYDVATLILASAFSPGTNAAVATLAASGSDPATGAAVVVSGWGRVSSGGALSANLLSAQLAVVGRSDCGSRWGSTNSITARMFCAHDTSRSACNVSLIIY